jgi:putative component of toxin-antitoxin plasmid stabilization module
MHVQQTERFEKSLETLRRGDGRASLAARNAERIIHSLADGDFSDVYHKLTCHGEARLANAVKFDLGSGYRMVSVKWGDAFLMLFAGSHDDCDRWLESNRGTSFVIESVQEGEISVRNDLVTTRTSEESFLEDQEEDIVEELSPRELRFLFRGLCGG